MGTQPAKKEGGSVLGGIAVLVFVFLLVTGRLSGGGDQGGAQAGDQADSTAIASVAVERKLAVINGDPSTEGSFARILDVLQAGTENCQPEASRIHVADILVASWQSGGTQGTLLSWAREMVNACGG